MEHATWLVVVTTRVKLCNNNWNAKARMEWEREIIDECVCVKSPDCQTSRPRHARKKAVFLLFAGGFLLGHFQELWSLKPLNRPQF